MTESEILKAMHLQATEAGARLFRNNIGLGWVGKLLRRTETTITLEHPRPLHAGLVQGSGDLVGWMPVTITPEMVGTTVAVFTSIEAKKPGGRASREQLQFDRVVREAGGKSIISDTPDSVVQYLLR